MTISKKFIHYIWFQNTLNIKKLKLNYCYFNYFNSGTLQILNIITINNNKVYSYFIKRESYKIIYNLIFIIKTKHLFLFTIYLLYTKLLYISNVVTYKFHYLKKKQKKLTILRAPCNHKNSKEQYGYEIYKGILTSNSLYISNKFYHAYLIQFLNSDYCKSKLLYTLYKNEKKSFK